MASPSSVVTRPFGQSWRMLLLRGILAILFGILAFAWPSSILLLLTTIFAVYAFVDGILAVVAGLTARWPLVTILGVIGILVGLLAFFHPGVLVTTAVFVIAVWSILRGAAEIAAAVELRRSIPNEWSMILDGILSVLFGVLLFAYPIAGALSVVLIIGAYAIVVGILRIVVAFRVKKHPWLPVTY
jgi:uncharacterized membrane protein HdeD (DUF308 family)